MNNMNIEALETIVEELRVGALRQTEAYMLAKHALEVLKGEDHDEKARREANTALQAGGEALLAEGDGSMPHEGLPSRVGGVRKGGGRVSGPHARSDKAASHNLQTKVVMPRHKPLKIAAKDRQKVCEICGQAYTVNQSGHRNTCSDECEKERRRRMVVARATKRRAETAAFWEEAPPREPSKIDEKLKELNSAGITYADQQKADSIERFARINVEDIYD